ncbi:hypothetical protein OHC33_003798 [Knufia fluminis]|uniref:Uncharacterized protein n=1 Tax=Knufia fluminis TaxID=191047 RepID=A0AAN8EGI8_9EURO|nr:hypothetical protein OHC33_003798 [Knufia fluminis]
MDADDTSVDLDEQLDCTSEANQPQSRLSAEAIKQSRQELDELLDLSRLAAYAMILDPILFTKEEDLPIANDLLIDRLFPPSFDRKRINRTFRKLAENTLLRGSSNLMPYATNPPIPELRLQQYIINHRKPIRAMRELREQFPDLVRKTGRASTWRDMMQIARKTLTRGGKLHSFVKVVRDLQVRHAIHDLGFPAPSTLGGRRDPELEEKALSSEYDWWEDAAMAGTSSMMPDLVLVRSEYENINDIIAFVQGDVINLTPRFWMRSTSLVGAQIRAGVTTIADVISESRLQTFMHELFHIPTVLGAIDAVMYHDEIEDACAEHDSVVVGKQEGRPQEPCKPRFRRPLGRTYGYVRCLALRILDVLNGSLQAEANAETWAIYGMLRLWMLAYPEMDFLSGPVVTHREQFLHHCTVFNILRHPDAITIEDLPGYKPEKDPWLQEKGERTPNTVKSLLNQMIAMNNRYGTSFEDMLEEAWSQPTQEDLADSFKDKLHL